MTNSDLVLTRRALEWFEPWWDHESGLLWNPPDAHEELGPPGTQHLVPQSSWYALGLLARDEPGDRARAERTLHALCDLQYDEPGRPWHGAFARILRAARPDPGAREWIDYDPNWRQFLPTALVLMLDDFDLDANLSDRIVEVVERAVAAEPRDRVPVWYTNVALLRAWLEGRFGDTEDAEAYASRIVERFDAWDAFDEYNSPTYSGLDLLALALWRRSPPTERFAEWGARLEAALWRDLARWYHPRIQNLCGPWSRSYGMDMTRYASFLGFWIASVTGVRDAPLPALDAPIGHAHDVAFASLVDHVGTVIPEGVDDELRRFEGERRIEQRLAGNRRMTGWLDERVMIGAESGAVWPAEGQFHPATLHWQAPGGVGWIRVTHPGTLHAEAAPRTLTVKLIEPGTTTVIVHVPGSPPALDGTHWDLAGLSVDFDTDGEVIGIDADADVAKVRFARAVRLALEVDPT